MINHVCIPLHLCSISSLAWRGEDAIPPACWMLTNCFQKLKHVLHAMFNHVWIDPLLECPSKFHTYTHPPGLSFLACSSNQVTKLATSLSALLLYHPTTFTLLLLLYHILSPLPLLLLVTITIITISITITVTISQPTHKAAATLADPGSFRGQSGPSPLTSCRRGIHQILNLRTDKFSSLSTSIREHSCEQQDNELRPPGRFPQSTEA